MAYYNKESFSKSIFHPEKFSIQCQLNKFIIIIMIYANKTILSACHDSLIHRLLYYVHKKSIFLKHTSYNIQFLFLK